ncbi:diacylglycerol kinase family protein [Paraglaciecola marina]|uniref:diacylglycerol kinase family protein n=1 Tax=Paraglaciecola marina TaxID=2500157 RepID=UPI00105DA400|nr:diacylglycerol kinase family protein [Paraglaciecola marina]
MTITFYYALLALLILIAAWAVPNIYTSLGLIWISVSLLAVTFAYLLEQPGIFRKKHDGSIPLYIRWLFIPFLIGVQFYNTWARKRDAVPPIQKIEGNLYLACRLFPSDVDELRRYKVSSVLDVTAEFSGLGWVLADEEWQYLNIPVLDHQSPTDAQLSHAINWIDIQRAVDSGVVIHCALGRGRSVFVMAAYLLSKHPDWSVEQALKKIQGVRQTANLNKRQLKHLNQIHAKGGLVSKSKLALIANPVSGSGKWLKYKQEVLQRLSVRFEVQVFETTKQISAKKLTQQALNAHCQTIVACGGDGTINEVASQLVDTNVALGMIPLGTTNALCHVLFGISSKIVPISRCCELIIKGDTQTIDTLNCNQELVLLMVGIGLGQKMIKFASRSEKNESGQLAYIQGLWQAIQLGEGVELTLAVDDKPQIAIHTTSLVAANAAPFSTILAQGGGQPDLTDGKMDLTWLPSKGEPAEQLFNFSGLAINAIAGSQISEQCFFCQAKQAKITANKDIDYVVDGENRTAKELLIVVKHKSLKVIYEADVE